MPQRLVRSLSSQKQDWKRRFLGALNKAGLKKPLADRLMYNRGLLEVWIRLLPEADHPMWGSLRSWAALRRAELALAAAIALKYRVEETTTLRDLDLTIRTHNMCDAVGFVFVGDILAQETLPINWRPKYEEGVREELRDFLIAGGVAPGRLPEWLTVIS